MKSDNNSIYNPISPNAKLAQLERWLEHSVGKLGNCIATSFLRACVLELIALKPGNVHVYADGHNLTVDHFIRSAEVCAPIIADCSLGLGKQIKSAIVANQSHVATNTNLGIILLCAPISQAACNANGSSLRKSVIKVIERSNLKDAQLILEAIRIAAPSGLGKSTVHDAHEDAKTNIREIMQVAKHRDMIARQYSNGFNEVFDFGFSMIHNAEAARKSAPETAAQLYLGFLSEFLDSHIVRQHGIKVAQEVKLMAKQLHSSIKTQKMNRKHHENMLNCDKLLKQRDINPGTSADLTVATLFAKHVVNWRKSNC